MSLDGRLVGTDDEQFSDFYAPLLERMIENLGAFGIDTSKLVLEKAGDGEEDYCQQIGSYSGIQLLRNYAAHVAVHNLPPTESNRQFIVGPELNQMYNHERLFNPFDNLINHSDSEGYYIPLDFAVPLHFDVPQSNGPGVWICDLGSSQALLRELDQLNIHLKMPGDYGDLGGYDQLSSLIENDEFGVEKWAWAVMHWLARVSVERSLLFEFC